MTLVEAWDATFGGPYAVQGDFDLFIKACVDEFAPQDVDDTINFAVKRGFSLQALES